MPFNFCQEWFTMGVLVGVAATCVVYGVILYLAFRRD